MITVDRNNIAPPSVLYGENSIGRKETIASVNAFKAEKKFDNFEAYSHPEVKWKLFQLFHGKCAYCESKYANTQPMDVEHFRPKGAVSTNRKKLDHSGYYWLAAEWSNLLPSCIDCNRQRGQQSGLTGNYNMQGKAYEFPIKNESNRAVNPGEEVNESCLLLNPCNLLVRPEEHLDFKEDGIVLPIKKSIIGMTSIKIFGLNRMPLVRARKEKISKIKQTKFAILCLISEITHSDSRSKNDFKLDMFYQQLDILATMCSPKEEFTALGQQHISPFINNLTS